MSGFMPDQAQNLRDLVSGRTEMRVVTIASGKGGVGKSSVSVNLAIALSRLGIRVLVLDADFGLANVDVMLGVTTKYNVGHFLRGEKELHEIVQLGHEGVRFISGGSGVYELLSLGDEQLGRLISGIKKLDAPVDFILIDSGAGINDKIVQLILASSELIVVTTPEPTSILDAYALVKTIVTRDKAQAIHVIMNKCENKREAQRVSEGFREVIIKHLGKEINTLGAVMYDHDVPSSIKRQTPIIVSNPDSIAVKGIRAIARNLMELPEEKPRQNKLAEIFGRMMRKD